MSGSDWTWAYRDALANLFWTPKYLGLASIPDGTWRREGDRISLPADRVPAGNAIYTRSRKYDDWVDWVAGQEEILNHLFDLTFAIAPDPVLTRVLGAPAGLDDPGPFDRFGRNLRHRYGWNRSENVTQVDGYFVSARSVLAVELKLGSRSSPGQIAKYAALMAWEEALTGRREDLALLYVLPTSGIARHWRQCGLDGPRIDPGFADRLDPDALPGRIAGLYRDEPARMRDLLARLRLAVIDWSALAERVQGCRAGLDPARAGDACLDRLLAGFQAGLVAHSGTELMQTDVRA